MTPSSWRIPFPRSLAGQLIGLLLIALFVAQAISIWIFHDERRIALIEVARDNILMRAVSIAKLIDETPESLQARILEASSSRHTTFWIGEAPVVRDPGTDSTEIRLQQILADRFSPPRDVLLDLMDPRSRQPDFGNLREDDEDKDGERPQRPSLRAPSGQVHPGRLHRLKRGHIDLALSIPLSNGSFLNVETNYRPPPRTMKPLLVQLGLMAVAVILIVAFAVRRVSRPLRDLANAAERLGRGEDVAELEATGPLEVRTVTEAFNSMQDRLTHFVRDRTRMLAAISHDLRTPLNAVIGYAEMLEAEMFGALGSPKYREYSGDIAFAGRHLLEIIDDILYGRGATDMKSAIAAFIEAVSRLQAEGGTTGSISLLITGDEEGPAINGTKKVLDWIADNGETIDVCLVGEPTNPNKLGEMVKIGRRGSLTGRLTVTGIQGHTAYPHLADNPLPRLARMLDAISTHRLDEGTDHFQPSNLQLTTIDTGNPATNLIPASATAGFNIRFNDLHTGDSLTDWLHRECGELGGHYELDIKVSGEAFLTPPGDFSALIAKSVEQVTGITPELSTSGGHRTPGSSRIAALSRSSV